MASYLACALLLIGCGACIFWNQAASVVKPSKKTRLDYLRERRDVVYDNLRDLNFEFRAGKYPAEDYESQRASMEAEAASIVTEMEHLEAGGTVAAARR